MDPLARFCDWLAATPISQTVQSTAWVVPTVQSVHILAIAMVLAPAVLLDARLLGVGRRSQPIPRLFASLNPLIGWALVTLLISGAVLIVAEPRRELLNLVFRTKMVLLVAALLVTAGLQRWAGRRASPDAAEAPSLAVRAAAVLSLVLWVAIIGCGRWIAYVEHG